MKYLIFFLILFSCSYPLLAFQQQEESGADAQGIPLKEENSSDEIKWATPGVAGDRPGKGIVVSYNLIAPFNIRSMPVKEGLEGGEAEVRKLEDLAFSLRLPVSWSGQTKIIAGLEYAYREYNFKQPEKLEYNFYENLENKHLNALSFRAYILHSLDEKRFIGSRIGAELNGDYHDLVLPFTKRMKYSFAALYGWKADAYTTYGAGLYYSYVWGRPSVYPAFLWNRTYSEKWGVEALLPQSFRLRYTFNPQTFLLGGLRVSGESYHILSEQAPLSAYSDLELRNSNVFAFLEFEREIYDFLWFGLTGGFRYNVNFYMSEKNSFSNSRILENEVAASPYFNASLFVVPPAKFRNKASLPDAETEQ